MDNRAREYEDPHQQDHMQDPDKMPVNQDHDEQEMDEEQGNIDEFIEILQEHQ